MGKGEAMPFGDAHFDLVTSNNGLNNVEDQEKVLSECFRVCKPGAQLVLTMNLPHTMIEFYDALRYVLEDMEMLDEIRAMEEHISDKRKPADYLSDLILASGFRIRSIQVDGFRYRFASAGAFFSHYMIRNFFKPPWLEFLPIEKRGEIFARVEKLLDKGPVEMSIPFVCFDCFKS
jgi:ubiquinone/menaquinone biosynthesis C-methylase UbiE